MVSLSYCAWLFILGGLVTFFLLLVAFHVDGYLALMRYTSVVWKLIVCQVLMKYQTSLGLVFLQLVLYQFCFAMLYSLLLESLLYVWHSSHCSRDPFSIFRDEYMPSTIQSVWSVVESRWKLNFDIRPYYCFKGETSQRGVDLRHT